MKATSSTATAKHSIQNYKYLDSFALIAAQHAELATALTAGQVALNVISLFFVMK